MAMVGGTSTPASRGTFIIGTVPCGRFTRGVTRLRTSNISMLSDVHMTSLWFCEKDVGCVDLVIRGFNNDSITGTREMVGITSVMASACTGNGSIMIIMSTRNSAASSLVRGTGRVGPGTSGERGSVLLTTNRRVSVSLLTVTVRGLNCRTISLLN